MSQWPFLQWKIIVIKQLIRIQHIILQFRIYSISGLSRSPSGSGTGRPPGGFADSIFVSKYPKNDHKKTFFSGTLQSSTPAPTSSSFPLPTLQTRLATYHSRCSLRVSVLHWTENRNARRFYLAYLNPNGSKATRRIKWLLRRRRRRRMID